jgi:hypothetical protein
MSHLIQELDLTFSVRSSEWHGLAIMPEGNDENERFIKMPELVREHLCFPLIEADYVAIDRTNGNQLTLDHDENDETRARWKLILADLSACPVHPGRERHPKGLVQVHSPKQSYFPLENGKYFELAENAFSSLGLPFKVSTAGTLGNLSRFYFCVSGESILEFKTPDGHKVEVFFSFYSDHTGALRPMIRLTVTRIVCANTWALSLGEQTDFEFCGKHTEGGIAKLEEFPRFLEKFITGQKTVSDSWEKLANQSVTLEESREIVAGFFFSELVAEKAKIPATVKLSKQAENATESIILSARHGQGNSGQSRWDLLQGATDYWSNGNGIGSASVGLRKRVSMSHFGAASDHKRNFAKYIANDALVTDCKAIGKLALANAN